MVRSVAIEEVWRPLPYPKAWSPFEARFDFRPSFYERQQPALTQRRWRRGWPRRPLPQLVIDLSTIFGEEGSGFDRGERKVNDAAMRAFVELAGPGPMTALDWQHTPYAYLPLAHVAAGLADRPVPVFPNGDYYVHFPP